MLTAAPRRRILAGAILAVGSLQTWDSDVLSASPPVWILAGVALLVAASAPLLTANRAAGWIAAVVLPGLLLVAARMISPIPLPAILIIPVAAGALLGGNEMLERQEAEEKEPGRAR